MFCFVSSLFANVFPSPVVGRQVTLVKQLENVLERNCKTENLLLVVNNNTALLQLNWRQMHMSSFGSVSFKDTIRDEVFVDQGVGEAAGHSWGSGLRDGRSHHVWPARAHEPSESLFLQYEAPIHFSARGIVGGGTLAPLPIGLGPPPWQGTPQDMSWSHDGDHVIACPLRWLGVLGRMTPTHFARSETADSLSPQHK